MKTIRKYNKGELYEDKDREILQSHINHLSFMGLTDKQKSFYCNLALRHLGLNINMVSHNCIHCGIKNCKVKKIIYKVGI